MGHTEGITYVSAKGDGRYVISNGKDQNLRLWDLRKMRSNQDLEAEEARYYGTNFDYRFVWFTFYERWAKFCTDILTIQSRDSGLIPKTAVLCRIMVTLFCEP
jgi:WD40 repeat protein